jgi:hypothetical protein
MGRLQRSLISQDDEYYQRAQELLTNVAPDVFRSLLLYIQTPGERILGQVVYRTQID